MKERRAQRRERRRERRDAKVRHGLAFVLTQLVVYATSAYGVYQLVLKVKDKL